MLIREIEGATRRLGAPADWDQSKSACDVLPIVDVETDNGPFMVSAWQPTAEELAALNAGAPIRLWIQGTNHPVVALAVDAPAEQNEVAPNRTLDEMFDEALANVKTDPALLARLHAAVHSEKPVADERTARLDDEDIDAIAESMPGGLPSFMKQWGWRQFARAVEDEVLINCTRAPSSNATGPEVGTDLNERAHLAAGQWATSNTPIAEALAYRDGFIAGANAPAQSAAPAAVPADVRTALDRMCTPLDESVLSGATATADAHSMKVIRDYVLRDEAPALNRAEGKV
ncbi:hypothetical protein [Burkholderia sp. Ac-20384]|uniref:hypothetical protein n=1 Tax=Burkholderia sp. Ac-20384 TaxID=2703902 RepID=UPI0019805426|nr:hypothetical protein [Burkholderia sp. Ac-20384]